MLTSLSLFTLMLIFCYLFIFLLRQSSLWPHWLKTYQNATQWLCQQNRWWTAVRSGWCTPTFRSRPPSARANRPSTTDTPQTDRVGFLFLLASRPLCYLVLLLLTQGFFKEVSHTNCGNLQYRCVCVFVWRLSCGQDQPLPLTSAFCDLWSLCGWWRPLVNAKWHQLTSSPDPLPLQCKSCLAPSTE